MLRGEGANLKFWSKSKDRGAIQKMDGLGSESEASVSWGSGGAASGENF